MTKPHQLYVHLLDTARGDSYAELPDDTFNEWVADHPVFAYTAANAYCQSLTREERNAFSADEPHPMSYGEREARDILDAMYPDIL